MINIHDITFSYNKKNVNPTIKNLSLNIQSGESVGLIGPNGAGKSTLLKLLVGLEKIQSGLVEVASMPVDGKHIKEIRKKAGFVFQDSESQLFMSSVFDDVAFGLRQHKVREEEVKIKVEEALIAVNMQYKEKEKIYRLSGGEKKLASIATILPMNPELILMDEPAVALDPSNRRQLINVINNLVNTKLIASHDLDFIYDTCERTVLIFEGRIVADDDSKILLRDKDLLERYGLELPLSFSR